MSKPIIAIVGRPNVGKSMLFNKIIGRRLSIVEDTPGVTRDRIYGESDWQGRKFTLIDTGGIEPRTDNQILAFMRSQAQIAIDNATVIVFLCDIKTGMTASDQEVASMLQRCGKPVILAVNKVDQGRSPDIYEFYNLGLGDPIAVSAVHGHGTGDLLDACVQYFPPEDEEEEEDDAIKVAVIGKPNAGKSSLLNALLGYDRAIVTDIAGTTRDTVEEKVTVGGVLLRLIDTAGIRDGGDAVETMGVERSRAAAKQASLALLVLDGSRELTAEDEAAIALANTVPHLIVAVNKSDLPRALDVGALADRFDNVLSVSAVTGAGLDTLTDAIAAQFPSGETAGGALLTNARQADAANRALSAVAEARGALRIGMTPDVVLTDCEAALAALGELNGKQVRDDLVDTIFSRFCVGK